MAGATTEQENVCPRNSGLLVVPKTRNLKSGIPVPVKSSRRRNAHQLPLQPTQENVISAAQVNSKKPTKERKPVPDFKKLHQKWTKQVEKAKEQGRTRRRPLQVTQQATQSKTAAMSSKQKPLRVDHQPLEHKPVERLTTEHKPVERRPLEHKSTGANRQPSVEPVEGGDLFEECKSSLNAILSNQPIPVTGTNTRATIAATTNSQRKPLILGYHKMPWDDSPNFLARHSVYSRKKRNEMTPIAGGGAVNNRVREALERLVSTTIRKTEKIASRARDEEQSSLKDVKLKLDDQLRLHSPSPPISQPEDYDEPLQITPSIVRRSQSKQTGPTTTTSTGISRAPYPINTPSLPASTQTPIFTGAHTALDIQHSARHTVNSTPSASQPQSNTLTPFLHTGPEDDYNPTFSTMQQQRFMYSSTTTPSTQQWSRNTALHHTTNPRCTKPSNQEWYTPSASMLSTRYPNTITPSVSQWSRYPTSQQWSGYPAPVADVRQSQYEVDDELRQINNNARKPAGLCHCECTNPVGSLVLQNRFKCIARQ